MSTWLLVLVVLIIGVGILALVLIIKSRADSDHAKKMAMISGTGFQRNNVNDKDVKGRRLADLSRKLKDRREDEAAKDHKTKKGTIRDLLVYAGLNVPTAYFWGWSAGAAVATAVIALFFGASFPVVILMAVIGFFGVPRVVLKTMASRRQKKFLEEFADGLESMVRLLKAGMPVGEAISMIAREFTGPLGEEMGKVYESQRIGVSMGEAVEDMSRRMPLPEVQMFATGIIIQQQTGASLSEVLMNLSALIRARFRLKRKVQALSAEAKASAGIIGALPVLVATGLYFINPDYISLLFTTSSGKFYLTGAIIWMMIGMVVMKQMINFKV